MELLKILDDLNIEYDIQDHEIITTIEEAKHVDYHIPGIGAKSLFLRDKKHNYYIVVCQEDKRVDTKYLRTALGCAPLSFAGSDELKEILGLEAGGVTPLGIINDSENKVKKVIFDDELVGNRVLVHPNTLNQSMSISLEDMVKLIEHVNHEYMILKMN